MADMYLGNESGGFDLVGTTNIKNIDFEEAKISKEDYENLSEEEQKKGVYLVTGLDDIEDGGGRADLISYDNTNSGLGSTNVQGAIDELNSNLNNNQKPISIHDRGEKIVLVRSISSGYDNIGTILFSKQFTDIPEVQATCFIHDNQEYNPITITNITKLGFDFEIHDYSQNYSFDSTIAWAATGLGYEKMYNLDSFIIGDVYNITSSGETINIGNANTFIVEAIMTPYDIYATSIMTRKELLENQIIRFTYRDSSDFWWTEVSLIDESTLKITYTNSNNKVKVKVIG